MKKYKLNTGLILTEDEENIVKIENKVITIMPVWKGIVNLSSNAAKRSYSENLY
jgi:hypothetical protein